MPSRQHLSQQPHRRRPSLIDYSRRLATRMGINRPLPPATAAPSSSAVGSPRRPSHSNPTIEFGTSRTKEARCRFYYCVSIGIIFGLAVNIASTMFVVHRLRATRESASSQRSERLRNQDSVREVLQNVRVWQENAWYRTYIAADGTGRHADIRIGMYAEYVNPVHDLTTVKDPKKQRVKNWSIEEAYKKYHHVQIDERSGVFTANKSGVYQMYSTLAFRGGTAQNSQTFTQEIWLNDKTVLFEDTQWRFCGSPQQICYTSVIFAAVNFTKGDKIHIEANPVGHLSCEKRQTFFGMMKLD